MGSTAYLIAVGLRGTVGLDLASCAEQVQATAHTLKACWVH